MRRCFGWQLPKRRSDCVCQSDDAEQCARNFDFRSPSAGPEMLDEQRDYKQQTKNDAPDPQGNWRPLNPHLLLGGKLKEEKARASEHGTGKHEAGAQDQRDTVLSALKANES